MSIIFMNYQEKNETSLGESGCLSCFPSYIAAVFQGREIKMYIYLRFQWIMTKQRIFNWMKKHLWKNIGVEIR